MSTKRHREFLDHVLVPPLSPKTKGPRPKSRREAVVSYLSDNDVYIGHPDELREDEHLQIVGEDSDPSIKELRPRSHSQGAVTVPIRLLTDFTLYNSNNSQLCDIFSSDFGASGIVSPYVEEADFEDDNDDSEEYDTLFGESNSNLLMDSYRPNIRYEQRVKLSKIKEVWLDPKFEDPLARIWICTRHAWYILQEPSEQYRPIYEPTLIVHLISHLIANSLRAEPALQYHQFVTSLDSERLSSSCGAVMTAARFLGRRLSSSDLQNDEIRANIQVNIRDWLELYNFKHLRETYFIETFLGTDIPWCDDYTLSSSDDNESDFESALYKNKRRKTSRNSIHKDLNREKLVPKQIGSTVSASSTIAILAESFFRRSLVVSGYMTNDIYEGVQDMVYAEICNSDAPVEPVIVHLDDPASIRWGEQDPKMKCHYLSVFIDGVEYKPGDTVIVQKGDDSDTIDAANAKAASSGSTNKLAENWFCEIQYFFEGKLDPGSGKAQKLFHARWFQHSSQTLLAETSNPRTLFLMNKCDTNPLSCIIRKCQIYKLGSSAKEPILNDTNEHADKFHFAFVWDRNEFSFTDVDLEDISIVKKYCKDWKACYSCALAEQKTLNQIRINDEKSESFHVNDNTYHLLDFVYIYDGKNSLLTIGQITAMDTGHSGLIRINLYIRFQDVQDDAKHDTHDRGLLVQRQLCKTDIYMDMDPIMLVGHCVVQHYTSIQDINDYMDHDDHYLVKYHIGKQGTMVKLAQNELKNCSICQLEEASYQKVADNLKHSNNKLKALELFSGAGGLSLGMKMSGYVETKWAVEISASAAETFRMNHPETAVFTEDTNSFFRRVTTQNDPEIMPGPICDTVSLPEPGHVDIIMGGPPCQSFSGMNRYKKADDIRNALVCNMLSYVEHLQPSYFLLENVVGLLNARLRGKQDGHRIIGGIEGGIIKFVVRSLTALGYQVSFKILEAAQYGTPQSRKRLIIWGAKRGIRLPAFPKPTHTVKRLPHYYKFSSVGMLRPISRRNSYDSEGCSIIPSTVAPFPMVTINDAIGDLPSFNWINPHILIPAVTQTPREYFTWQTSFMPQFLAHAPNVKTGASGYTGEQAYECAPQTPYQQWSRRTMHEGQGVLYQYTRSFAASIVERVVNVPIRANADHADLPSTLRRVNKVSGEGFEKHKGTYCRLDGDGLFQTIMTSVKPNSKQALIHPSQKRSLTVRECARAQGFPDSYKFSSLNKISSQAIDDQHRQIGNAVPIPLALALGKALGESMVRSIIDRGRGDGFSTARQASPEL